MKKFLPFLALILVACAKPKGAPTEPVLPSYIGLPIASYTVISTNDVQPSGSIPIGSSVTYLSTYSRRSQLTAGSSATLTLSGMSEAKIRSITLHMRSNKSSGAGSLIVANDNIPVWTIDNANFSSSVWHGSYSTDTVSIFHLYNPYLVCGNELKITLTASVNSLYIMRYDIEYEPKSTPQTERDSSLFSELKRIVFLDNLYRLTGPVLEGYISVKDESEPITNDDLYKVEFIGDSLATILHHETGTYIGLSGTSLDDIATPWSVDITADTCVTFYSVIKGKYYMLATDPNDDFKIHLKSDTRLRLQYWKLFAEQ